MDNYFTSLPLAERLATRNTTLCGTIRSNRRELPPAAKNLERRQRGDARHYYCGQNTICSFWDKGRKPVLLLSNSHGVQENTSNTKPQIVVDYNSTKAGVDNLDKMVRGYRSKRKCRRWPYGVFFSLLDAAVIAAHKLFTSGGDNEESHYTFKRELAYEMAMPLVRRRISVKQITTETKQAMRAVGAEVPQTSAPSVAGPIRQGRCHLCPRARDKKSRSRCHTCTNFACTEHSIFRCLHCAQN